MIRASKYLWIVFLPLVSCKTKRLFDDYLLKNKVGDTEKGVIISCFRCNCVTTELKKIYRLNPTLKLYGDSNCVNLTDFPELIQLPQTLLDSIYERNFNLILFKRTTKSRFSFEIVQTKESLQLQKKISGFFN